MKQSVLTDVLYLIGSLFIVYVCSQTGCPSGWFGLSCKYKCRCTSDMCDETGACTNSSDCIGGWFGPACQYADLAYGMSLMPELTDGYDDTCTATGVWTANQYNVTIHLKQATFVAWLRVVFSSPDDNKNILVELDGASGRSDCWNVAHVPVNAITFDLKCHGDDEVTDVILSGSGVEDLCSVYISGGRNVALKETAEQSTAPNTATTGGNTTTADKAVDGNRYQLPQGSFSCSIPDTVDGSSNWTISLSVPRRVSRYVIYNRPDDLSKLIGFRLESFNSRSVSLFVYVDSSAVAQPNYTITHTPVAISTVTISSQNTVNFTLCEVEIYGDSVCALGTFGRDCEHSCHCQTEQNCSEVDGFCAKGCQHGFTGTGCQIPCSVGMFGDRCNSSCSENCAASDDEKATTCDPSSGVCLHGCSAGYTGKWCKKRTASDADFQYQMEALIGLCVLAAVTFVIIYCFCKKRPTKRQKPERAFRKDGPIPASQVMSTVGTDMSTMKSEHFADNDAMSAQV